MRCSEKVTEKHVLSVLSGPIHCTESSEVGKSTSSDWSSLRLLRIPEDWILCFLTGGFLSWFAAFLFFSMFFFNSVCVSFWRSHETWVKRRGSRPQQKTQTLWRNRKGVYSLGHPLSTHFWQKRKEAQERRRMKLAERGASQTTQESQVSQTTPSPPATGLTVRTPPVTHELFLSWATRLSWAKKLRLKWSFVLPNLSQLNLWLSHVLLFRTLFTGLVSTLGHCALPV